MSNCRMCNCIIDHDDEQERNDVCGSCIRDTKQAKEYGNEHENVCVSCKAIIPANWSRCPHCGGNKKYA